METVIVHCPACGQALSIPIQVKQLNKYAKCVIVHFSSMREEHVCPPGHQ